MNRFIAEHTLTEVRTGPLLAAFGSVPGQGVDSNNMIFQWILQTHETYY